MFKKIFLTLFILFSFNTHGYSEIFSEVSVNGNKRISKESIIIFGQIDLSKDLNKDDLNEILKNLYDTDFFDTINISSKNKTLLIDLIENPIIENVEINGIDSEEFKKRIQKSLILSSRKSFKESSFKSDLIKIKSILRFNGYYFSDIKSSYTKNDELGTTSITYDINLGEKAKITDIQFIGDKKVKDKVLQNVIVSEINRFWKFLSRNVYLNTNNINLDKRLLENYYKNNGYFNVEINNSFVEIKNNNSFKLVYNINAGSKYTFNKLSLNLPDDFKPIYFTGIKKLLSKLEGKTYSLNKIDKVLNEIDKVALSKQYEFINADITESITDDYKVDILISMKETEKFYVEKINISGNNLTLEEVIRHSFIVDEGDPYNEILFNKSINNLKSKNIFGFVKSKIKDGSDKNLKIIDIEVEEKPTGEVSLGAGLGTSGATIGGGIKESNFLGKGIKLDTNLAITVNSLKGKISIIRPNFNYSDNTLFTSFRSDSVDNMSGFGYKTDNIGFSIGTGYEQYENLIFRPEIDISFENLQTDSKASSALKKQAGNYQDFYFNYTLDYDLRDKRYKPTDGYITTFSQQLPVVSNSYELTNTFTYAKYKTLVKKMVGKFSIYASSVTALSDDNTRISKRVFMPPNKLRGFESGKVGPKDNKDFIGGNYVSAVNFSTTLPQLLPAWDAADFSFFIDAGNVWGVDYDKSLKDNSQIRSSTGITLDLLSPVGPMNFTLSQPLTKNSGDITESFRFNIGTSF